MVEVLAFDIYNIDTFEENMYGILLIIPAIHTLRIIQQLKLEGTLKREKGSLEPFLFCAKEF